MRLDYSKAYPAARQAMFGLELAVHESSLEPLLLELVKIRASQLNGCASCLEMHTKDARARGESDDRLHLVAAWREAPIFTERERAALSWCEELTLLADTGASDAAYTEVATVFSEEELVALTLSIVAINGWNRFAVGFRSPVGSYTSRVAQADKVTSTPGDGTPGGS
jgi:AhpD family alkylhydroperoxidase